MIGLVILWIAILAVLVLGYELFRKTGIATWLREHVASLGQNIQFVAACAHGFAAAYAISHVPERYRLYGAITLTVAAFFKEFWFDAKYEHNPPQTFIDNLEDFASWTLGAWIGVLG